MTKKEFFNTMAGLALVAEKLSKQDCNNLMLRIWDDQSGRLFTHKAGSGPKEIFSFDNAEQLAAFLDTEFSAFTE